jgi:phytoene synthase
MNRIYLPETEMTQFGVTADMILSERMTDNIRNLMKFQVDRAHRYYEQANPGIAVLAKKSQFAIYAASTIYRGILRKIEARDYNPFLGRVFVPQSKKIGILLDGLVRTRLTNEKIQPIPAYTQSYHFAEDL